MAAALCINANCCGITAAAAPTTYPPINFFYSHFHDSIRNELDLLSQSVLDLALSAQEDLQERLASLKSRYRFLEQVYKYHSSVEDEVSSHILCNLHMGCLRSTLCVQGLLMSAFCLGCVSSTGCQGQKCNLGLLCGA